MEEELITFTQTVPAYPLGPVAHFGVERGGEEIMANPSCSSGRVGVGRFVEPRIGLGLGLEAEQSHESGRCGETGLWRDSAQHAAAGT